MAKPKNPKNGTTKIEKALEKSGRTELSPPRLSSGVVKSPKQFTSIGDVIEEQMRLYKMVFKGEILITDLTKLMYALQQIIQGFKAKAEIDALEDAYIKQWQGVRILTPAQVGTEQDPHDWAIENDLMPDSESDVIDVDAEEIET